jgi:predicted GNAT family acetyltransferase
LSETTRDDELLDNPVWHALRGPLFRFASKDSAREVLHFDREVSIFSAVERVDDATWGMIADEVGRGGFCGLFRDEVPAAPEGWEELFRSCCLQMVAEEIPAPSGVEVERLGAADASEMLALVELTEPGPFASRTGELGRYIGVRREGRLLAMAGERFRVPGHVEISGVCTHPDARGEGLAAELTLNVAQSIRKGGDEAFLHVLEDNENAIRLYQKLGFATRRKVDVVFAQWNGIAADPSDES